MAKKKEQEKPELNPNQKEQKTIPLKEKVHKEEEKPPFKDLLTKGKESASSKESSLPGSEDEFLVDENIVEICKDLLGMGFDIWNKINPKVPPLSDSAKKHISQPMARMAAKYDVGKYFKDEFIFCGYLGFEIYKRIRIPKHDKDHNREKGSGEDEPDTRINPERTS